MLTDTEHPQQTKLIRTYELNVPSVVGFISLQQFDLQKEQLLNPVGFALVRLTGNYYEYTEIAHLVEMPLDREKFINFILSSSEILPFASCFIDKENYIKFNSDHLWQRLSSIKSNQTGKQYPTLRATIRPDDVMYRQKESLNVLLGTDSEKKKYIKKSKSIESTQLIKVGNIGNSAAIDALAGAMDQISKIQKNIYSQIARQQNSNVINYTVA